MTLVGKRESRPQLLSRRAAELGCAVGDTRSGSMIRPLVNLPTPPDLSPKRATRRRLKAPHPQRTSPPNFQRALDGSARHQANSELKKLVHPTRPRRRGQRSAAPHMTHVLPGLGVVSTANPIFFAAVSRANTVWTDSKPPDPSLPPRNARPRRQRSATF